jgi:hypothetical protein
MSDAPITVHVHPPERRGQRSTVLTCGACCCCCCCLHSVGALLGAALAPLMVKSARSGSVLAWFWGAVGACLMLSPIVGVLYMMSSGSRSPSAVTDALYTGGLGGLLLTLIGGFPIVTLFAGIIALVGVSAFPGRDREQPALGVVLLTVISLAGAALGLAIMVGGLMLISHH